MYALPKMYECGCQPCPVAIVYQPLLFVPSSSLDLASVLPVAAAGGLSLLALTQQFQQLFLAPLPALSGVAVLSAFMGTAGEAGWAERIALPGKIP